MIDPTELTVSDATVSSGDAGAPFTLMPKSLEEANAFAKVIASSDLVPPDYKGKPANVLVAVQMGAELGLKPLQAVQGIAIVNGRPNVYGDALIALVRASPHCEWVHEHLDEETMVGMCIAKRRGQYEERRTFSQADAEAAGLWGRQGPWKQYPKRMLQMRARSWCLRDLFADVLKGVTVAEEVRDYIDVTPVAADNAAVNSASETRHERLASKLSERAQAVHQKKVESPITDPNSGSHDEPAADNPASRIAEVLAMIAQASTEADLETCAKAVNAIDAEHRRKPSSALIARIRKLKGESA